MVRNFHNGKEIDVSKVVIREKDAPLVYEVLAESERKRNEKGTKG